EVRRGPLPRRSQRLSAIPRGGSKEIAEDGSERLSVIFRGLQYLKAICGRKGRARRPRRAANHRGRFAVPLPRSNGCSIYETTVARQSIQGVGWEGRYTRTNALARNRAIQRDSASRPRSSESFFWISPLTSASGCRPAALRSSTSRR